MSHRSVAHRRPAVDIAPQIHVVKPNTSTRTGGGLSTLLENVAQEILAMTYWFDPASHPGRYPVTVRFTGRRVDVKGRLTPGDRFVQDETIESAIPGSSPISLTTKVRGINPGSWAVTASVLVSTDAAHGSRAFPNSQKLINRESKV